MRGMTALLAGIILLTACGSSTGTGTDAASSAYRAEGPSASRADAQEHQDVARLRAATEKFHKIEVAALAGWNEQVPPGCFTSPDGSMGFHFRNLSKVGTLNPTEPQFVMYEPQKDGSMRLVGVEFIALGAPTDTPPVLFGQPFQWNSTFGIWALHVWAWRENPSGLYANWNPKVSCQYATNVVAMAHH
jgi:hypothetical protein